MHNSIPTLAIAGFACAVLTVLAWLMDRRRIRRSNLDRVGFMPWIPIFFWALLAAVLLLGLSGRAWIAG